MGDIDVTLLQERLETHIAEFQLHIEEEDARWDHLIAVQESNTSAITNLTAVIAQQSESTHDMVEAWNAAHGAIKVGSALGRFVKWLSGLAVIGVAVTWLLEHLKS